MNDKMEKNLQLNLHTSINGILGKEAKQGDEHHALQFMLLLNAQIETMRRSNEYSLIDICEYLKLEMIPLCDKSFDIISNAKYHPKSRLLTLYRLSLLSVFIQCVNDEARTTIENNRNDILYCDVMNEIEKLMDFGYFSKSWKLDKYHDLSNDNDQQHQLHLFLQNIFQVIFCVLPFLKLRDPIQTANGSIDNVIGVIKKANHNNQQAIQLLSKYKNIHKIIDSRAQTPYIREITLSSPSAAKDLVLFMQKMHELNRENFAQRCSVLQRDDLVIESPTVSNVWVFLLEYSS